MPTVQTGFGYCVLHQTPLREEGFVGEGVPRREALAVGCGDLGAADFRGEPALEDEARAGWDVEVEIRGKGDVMRELVNLTEVV